MATPSPLLLVENLFLIRYYTESATACLGGLSGVRIFIMLGGEGKSVRV
jgi:hypothetical protein